MRLAFLLYTYFPYGGLQRDFKRFVEEARKRGHECRVYCIEWEGDTIPGIDLRRVPARGASHHRRNDRYAQWVRSDLASEPVDGVVGFNKMAGLDIYFAADPCYLDKALHQRGPLYRRGRRFRHFAAAERAVFDPASATHILLISATEQEKFERYYQTPSRRMHLLPPGVSPQRRAPPDAAARRATKRAELGFTGDEMLLLFVGSGFITKGLERAIDALGEVRRAHPDAQLVIAGQDKMRRYVRQCRKQGLSHAIQFLGGRDDVADLMLAADVLVHPARAEAGGIVLLEALVAGLPVVVTDVCGYAHHVAASDGGIVLPSPFEQAALQQALLRFADPHFRAACAASALHYADTTDLYSMHQTGMDVIETVLQSGQGGNSG
tara:strand:+ start:250176 stop:251315 length:1140 start_codon:yes stop_codon:yes gene_type:complete